MQAFCSIPTNTLYAFVMQTGRPSKRLRPAFGERLHALREQAGLTQEQVAQKLGVSQRAYAFWEREPVALRADQLVTLARILGASADELLGIRPPRLASIKPAGKARQLFESVSKLPRRQQQKISEVVEALVSQHKQAA